LITIKTEIAINDEDIQQFMKSYLTNLASEFLTPREVIRDFLNIPIFFLTKSRNRQKKLLEI
jgi:hypothetical protein